VSNYNTRHLKELLNESDLIPAVNQIELSPFLQRVELVDFCREKGIAVEAYSPLARGRKLEDPRLLEIAANHGKTPAQIALRWGLEKDFIVIPKSVKQQRILENAGLFDFELTAEDRKRMDKMDENFFCISPSFNPETSPRWN